MQEHFRTLNFAVLLADVLKFCAGGLLSSDVGVNLVLRAVLSTGESDVLPSRLGMANLRRVVRAYRLGVLIRRRKLQRRHQVTREVEQITRGHVEVEVDIHKASTLVFRI